MGSWWVDGTELDAVTTHTPPRPPSSARVRVIHPSSQSHSSRARGGRGEEEGESGAELGAWRRRCSARLRLSGRVLGSLGLHAMGRNCGW